MKLQLRCEQCQAPLALKESVRFDQIEYQFLRCGHLKIEEHKPWHNGHFETSSFDGEKHAREYQIEDLQSIYQMDCNCLLTHQVGLGKTKISLDVVRNTRERLGKRKKLIIVKSSTIYQWNIQYKTWCDNGLFGTFIVQGTKGIIPPGFDTYIISMDTFGRMVQVEDKNKSMYSTENFVTEPERFKDRYLINIDARLKTVLGENPFLIVDECQSFKDPSSNRTKALVGFIKEMKVENKLFLSATPVKNRADEYFVVLNLLRPDLFPSLDEFRRRWLVRDHKNRFSSVAPNRLADFRSMLEAFVIRRETKDVLKDLPPFRREFEIIYVENEQLKKLYNKELDELKKSTESSNDYSWKNVQPHLMTLRRITGMAKIDFAIDYVDTFLETSENEKIAIGIHHQAVRDILFQKLEAKGFNPLKLSGEDSAQRKQALVQEFRKDSRRVLIINMLAGGVGIDGLEVCNNVIGLERAWNSVDEEQFEGRFGGARQAQSGLPVYCEYWIAKDTIDEDFHDMIEMKRKTCHEVTDLHWDLESDTVMLKDLIQRTVRRRL